MYINYVTLFLEGYGGWNKKIPFKSVGGKIFVTRTVIYGSLQESQYLEITRLSTWKFVTIYFFWTQKANPKLYFYFVTSVWWSLGYRYLRITLSSLNLVSKRFLGMMTTNLKWVFNFDLFQNIFNLLLWFWNTRIYRVC